VNPIVHAELSWLLAQGLPTRRDRTLVTCAGLAPDLDGLSLMGGVDAYGKFHHLLTHGAVAAVVTSLACAGFANRRAAVWGLSLAAFHLHLVCDLAGSGPGWPVFYFWPLARTEWFWAGQWDLASWQNALIGLGTTLACLAASLIWGRTVVELLSPRWDAEVVATVRRWLGRA